MRKGIFYMVMLVCTSLSILITSCPAYADSRSEQVQTGKPYSVWFFYEGKDYKIIGREKLVLIDCIDGKSVQVRFPELEEWLANCPQEKWPVLHFESDNVAEFYYNIYGISLQINDYVTKFLNDNKANNGWEDAGFSFDSLEISKPEDVRCDVISNIYDYFINMHFVRSY
ncbi:MAG: hypothetical protein HUJ83_10365 [Veillonella sp.]|nr:hypothetical protein [Veillonella sp.]